MTRKQLVKERLQARRRFYDALAKLERARYKAEKLRSKLEPDTFRVTFAFTPTELGIECKPTDEQVEKLGIKRALERLKRTDFITTVGVIARGRPDKETLERTRAEVLENTRQRFKSDGTLDLASFNTTAEAGESNEVQSGPFTAEQI